MNLVRCLYFTRIPFRIGFLVLFSPLFYASIPPFVTWLIIGEDRLFRGCTAFRQCASRVMVTWEYLKVYVFYCSTEILSRKSYRTLDCVTKVLAFVILGQYHEFVASRVLKIWTESCCFIRIVKQNLFWDIAGFLSSGMLRGVGSWLWSQAVQEEVVWTRRKLMGKLDAGTRWGNRVNSFKAEYYWYVQHY